MEQSRNHIKDCIVYKPKLYEDNRGIFSEIYKSSIVTDFNTKQSNCSVSKKHVLRGIHRTPYAKLVTCVKGSVYDVCVDLRENSSTYGSYFGIELNENNLYSLLIPSYCGHAFLALSDSIVIYHQTDEYDQTKDETYCYKSYGIDWPITDNLILSPKDNSIC